jgi:hypothetical protein
MQKRIKFLWFYIWGQTQGAQIIEKASQWGVRAEEEEAPMLGSGPEKGLGGYYELRGIPTWLKYPRMVQDAQEAVVTAFWWLVGSKGQGGSGLQGARVFGGWLLRPRTTKIDPNRG